MNAPKADDPLSQQYMDFGEATRNRLRMMLGEPLERNILSKYGL